MSDFQDAARRLLDNIKRDHSVLSELLEKVSSEWVYEDLVYRFWHHSWKVYHLQDDTERMVEALRALAPHDRGLNPSFEQIIAEGTGRVFEREDNRRWLEVTRPMVEAFFHARFMVEMAVKYGSELEEAPMLLPSGWAALLYLYKIR